MAARVLAWLGMAAVCASFGGCSKSDDAAPVGRQELPAAAAKAICDSLARCCGDAKFTFDEKNCRAVTTAVASAQLLGDTEQADTVDQTRVAYDDQAAGECVVQLASKSQCGYVRPQDVPACNKVLVGKVKAGGACGVSAECEGFVDGKATCDRPLNNENQQLVMGVCVSFDTPTVTRDHGKLGEDCLLSCYSDQDCDYSLPPGNVAGPTSPETDTACFRSEGLFCGATGRCEALAKLGESCNSLSGCVQGLFCNGRCTAPHPDGATCQEDYECESDDCLASGICGKSTPKVTTQQCANGRL